MSGPAPPPLDVLETRWVLPAEALLVPVSSLSPRARAALDVAEDSWALGVPRSRRPQKVVDRATADLLEELRRPCRLVDAVIEPSQRSGVDPESTLEQAFEALRLLVAERLLVPEGDPLEAQTLAPAFAAGQQFRGYEIERLVHLLEDVELYRARSVTGEAVALKLARTDSGLEGIPAPEKLRREAAILGHLTAHGGVAVAALLGCELEGERPFLATRWCDGLSLAAAAAERLALPPARRREAQRRLALELVAAYERLHRAGVVHGDVHPGNVLVSPDGAVTLVDFGSARVEPVDGALPQQLEPWSRALREAVGLYYDPQTAAAVQGGRMPPEASFATDRYAVAAMLYQLFTGGHYLPPSAEQERLLERLADPDPLPFTDHGLPPWPAVEAALRRELSRDPAGRFADLGGLAAALRRARPDGDGVAVAAAPSSLLQRTTARYDFDSPLLRGGPAPPRASLALGAAGVSWFLLRAAEVGRDPRLLALADLWSSRCEALWTRGPSDFAAPERGVTPERVGVASLAHGRPGVLAVCAAVAAARGDQPTLDATARELCAATEDAALPAELCLGRAGLLLAAHRLLARIDGLGPGGDAPTRLGRCIEEQSDRLVATIAAAGPTSNPDLPHLGFAHGWAGVLYALIETSADRGGDGALSQLHQRRLGGLAELARHDDHGRATWPGTLPCFRHLGATPDHAPGWCSGSAGHLLLWDLAARRWPDERRYGELALAAAEAAWSLPAASADLCCGLAGRAMALATLAARGGEWIARAEELLRRARRDLEAQGEDDDSADSMLRGTLGVALAELEVSERGRRAAGV